MKPVSTRKSRRDQSARFGKARSARRPRPLGVSLARFGSMIAIAGALFSAASPAPAATVFWDGDLNGTNGITDLGGTFSWQPGSTVTFLNPISVNPTTLITGATTDVYQFGGNLQTLLSPATINITTGTSITGLIFGATGGNGYTLTADTAGQSLNIGASGIVVNAGAFPTTVGSANLGLTMGGAQSWINNSANLLTVGGAVTTSGTNPLTLQAQSGGRIDISGAIGGSAAPVTVNSTGSGIVNLSGNNTYTGTTTLTAGTLRATTNATALGGGALQLNGGTLILADDAGLNFGRNTTVGASTTIVTDRLTLGAGVNETLGNLSMGAFTLTVNAGNLVNSTGTTGVTFGTTTVGTNAVVFETNNGFAAAGVTNTLTLGSVTRTTGSITVRGTGNTTITGGDTTATTGVITKNGAGTLTLGAGGGATYAGTGTITINGGSVVVGSAAGAAATTFTGTRALTFGSANTGGGTFNQISANTGASSQTLGGLSFLGGDGTVQSTFTSGATSATLTFGSLAARTTGATGNFIVSGGTPGTRGTPGTISPTTPNTINFTTSPGTGLIGAGAFFYNGSDFAYYDGAGFVGAPVYGTDSGFNTVATSGVLTGSSVNQITTTSGTTGTVTQLAAATVNGLKFAGNTTLATSTFLVTTPSILATGGAANITGTGGITTGGAADLIIRTDGSSDSLTISATTPITSTTTGGLTKTGAGKLTMSNVTTNAFTGNIFLNQGILEVTTGGTTNTPFGLQIGATYRQMFMNGGTFRPLNTFNDNVPSATNVGIVFNFVGAGGTLDVPSGVTLSIDDGVGTGTASTNAQLQGSGDLIKTGVGTLNFNSGTSDFSNFTGRIFVNAGVLNMGVSAANATAVLGSNAAGTYVASGANLNFNGQAGTVGDPLFLAGTGISNAGALTNNNAASGIESGTITLMANTSIGVSAAGSLTLSGAIVDNGNNFSLTKVGAGAGALILTGASNYTGGTTLSAGTLAIGNNSALGSGPLTVNGGTIIANGANNFVTTNAVTLNADTTIGAAATNIGALSFGALNLGGATRTITVPTPSSSPIIFTGAVTNGTGLTLAGTGTLILPGTGSFTGPGTVNGGGTLSVGATTLAAAGSVSVGTTVTSGLNFNADNIGGAAILLPNATVTLGGASSQALLGFQLGTGTGYDSLNLSGATGNVTVGTGGAVIGISPLTGFGPAPSSSVSYNLITTSGGGTISGFNGITLPLGTLPTGYKYAFSTSSTLVKLDVTAGAAGNLFWTGDVNNSWNGGAGSPNTNWNDSTDALDAGFTPNASNRVNFTSVALSGTPPVTTTLDQNFTVGGITVNNYNTGALTINQGAFGALTIAPSATAIVINSGGPASTTINAPIVLGGTQTWTVTDASQTLALHPNAPANGTITGLNATIIKLGAGALTLGGFNRNDFGINLSGGTLNINNGGSTTTNSAIGTGKLTLVAGVTLDNTSGVAQALQPAGSLDIGGDFTVTGTNSLSFGTGAVSLVSGNRQITVNGGTLIMPGAISSGAFGITKLGNGTLTLSGTNANTGLFTLSAGTVNINAAGALGAAGATVALNGGTINNTSGTSVTATAAGTMTWGGNINFGGSAPLNLPGAVALTTNRTVTANSPIFGINTNPLTLSGIVSGANNLTKEGSGSLILTNANTFGGATKSVTLNAGTLAANHATNNVFGAAGTTLIINGGALDAIIASAPAANYPQTWGGNFAFLGTNTLNLGTGAVALGAADRQVTTLASTLTVGGAISGTGTVGIIKGGNGTLVLGGASTYTGTTTINAGTLQLNVGTTGAIGSLSSSSGMNFTGTGTFIMANIGETSGSTNQTLASLSFSAGDGAVTINRTTAFDQSLTYTTGPSRSTGATGALFVGGTGTSFTLGTTAKMVLTAQTPNTILAPGIFVATGNVAPGAAPYTLGWYDTAGFVRSIAYTGTPDAGTSTTAGGATLASTNTEAQTTGAITAQTIDQFRSLNINGASAVNFTMSDGNQILSLGDLGGGTGVLLRNGGGTTVIGATGAVAGAIGTGGITATGAGNELIIRADVAADSIALNIPILSSTGALTKSGLGTLILGGSVGTPVAGAVSNFFSGNLFINGGTLQVNSSSASGGNGATGALNNKNITLSSGTLALNFDGDGTGKPNTVGITGDVSVNGNAAITFQRLGAGNPIGSAQFPTPVNKTLQLGALSFTSAGRVLTLTPANGYGLEFTGITTLDKDLISIAVAGATPSNVVQAVTLSGKVTGTVPGGSWDKNGAGTLALTNSTNDFVGNIILRGGGVLAFNSDAALGNPANSLNFSNGTAATALRAFGGYDNVVVTASSTGSNVVTVATPARLTIGSALLGSVITAIDGTSVTLAGNANATIISATSVANPLAISTGRTINLWGGTLVNNVIEVTNNTTLTLTNSFGSNNGPVTKSDLGTLVLAANNDVWAGQLSISAGAVRVTNAGGLGISPSATLGNTIVAATGGALQLQNVSIWDQLNLTGTGINTGGAVQAVGSGQTSTTNGLITLAAAATIGGDATNTLNVRGGITGAFGVTFAGAGNINVDTNPIASNVTTITKIGSGTTTLAVASPTYLGTITVNGGTLGIGGALGGGAGSLGGTGAITVNPGGALVVDNSVGIGISNRLSSTGILRPITLAGGSLEYRGNTDFASIETFGAVTFARGAANVVTVTAGANAGASVVFGAAARGTFGSSTALFRGSNLGSLPGPGVATISSSSGFAFVGAGAAGTVTKGVIPWALVDTNLSGFGSSFATADTTTGNLRALDASEYVPTLAAFNSSANVVLGSPEALVSSFTVNSLTLNNGGSVTIAPLQTLTVAGGSSIGGILAQATNGGISGGLLTPGNNTGSELIFHTNGDLTVDSVIVGNVNAPFVTKSGPGTLTLTKVAPYTGQTVINQGTLKLAAGTNTLNYTTGQTFLNIGTSGTLDLNGNSQLVQGFTTADSQAVGTGATVKGGAGSTLVINSDGSNRTYAGIITESVGVQRGGLNSSTFLGNSDYSGPTLVSGGTLILLDGGRISGPSSVGLDYGATLTLDNSGTVNLTDRLKDTAAISLRGGNLVFNGRAATNAAEFIGPVTLTSGASTIRTGAVTGTVASTELTLASLTRGVGDGTVTFNQQGGTALGLIGSTTRIYINSINGNSTATLGGGLTNNIIGPWAVVNGTDWASYSPTYGVGGLAQAGFPGYSNLGSAATITTLANAGANDNVNLDVAMGSSVLAADKTVNTLRVGNFAIGTIDINAGRTLTLGNGRSGGYLTFSNTAQVVGTAPDVGSVTSGGSELFIFIQGSATLTMNSAITGSGVTLIKSSDQAGTDGALILAGTNTYDGGTVVNVSGLTLAATGTIAAGTNGITLNSGTLTQTAGGFIASQAVKLNGASTLTLANSNTLTDLTFNVDGGTQTGPTVALGTNGVLTLAGGITAGGSNPGATASIGGTTSTLSLGFNNSFEIKVNGFSFNSKEVAPLARTLTIGSGAVVANGGILKTGTGLLSLAAANTFNGGVDLSAGGIEVANNAALGTAGSSTLTVSGNNTTLTADATGGRVVANSVIFGNSALSMTLGNYGAGTLTLNGPITWSTATGVARTLIVNATTTGGTSFNTQTLGGTITSAGAGNGLVKEGIGTLAITGNNAATLDWTGSQAVKVNNGLLQIGTDTALGAVPGVVQADNILLNGGGLSASASFTLNASRGIKLGAPTAPGAGVIDVGSTFTLTFGGIIADNGTGADGLLKSGAGTLVLTGVNTYTGATTLSAGTLAANSSSALGNGAAATNALIFSGGTLQATGAIVSPSTRPVQLVSNATIDTNGQTVSIAGAISGGVNSGSLTKVGTGTLTLAGANTFIGATTVNAGNLTLDYSAQNNSKLSDTAVLTLAGGGTVTLVGGSHGETVLSTTLSSGASSPLTSVVRTSGASFLNLNTITRNGTATIDFGANNIATTDNLNTNGIIGPWATVGGSNWAANSTNLADGLIVAYTGYVDVTRQVSGVKTIASDTTSNVRIIEGTGGNPASITPGAAGTTDINTLIQSSVGGSSAATYDPGTTDILRLGVAGGILIDPTAGALTLGTVANDGVLTAGGAVVNGAGSIILTNNSASTITVNSTIANNGSGAVSFTKSGPGDLVLTGTNTFSGGFTIDAGTVTISGTGTTGAATGAVAMNGGKLNLGGATRTMGALTITSPAVSGGNTVENGTLSGSSYTVSNAAGNVIIPANLAANTATLTKTGAGTLTLTGTYSHTGATSVNGGTVQFAGTNAGASTITANNAGSVIQLGSATGLTSANAVSITVGTTLDLNGFSATIGALTTVATATITNTSASTAASTAVAPGTPSGAGVYVDALTVSPATAANVAALITDGATRKTQIVLNNANASIAMLSNTANTFSGGLVLANNGSGTRLNSGAAITGTPWGTGPIIIGQANTDKAGIFFSAVANQVMSNPIIFNTALGTDRVGIRSDVGGTTLSGVITANLAPATFTSNAATGASFNLTNQVTGAFGLVLDIVSLSSAATSFNVTLNNATINPNNYQGDTVINFNAATGKSATLNLGAANQIPNGTGAGNVVINSNGTGIGTLNLAGFNETINGLTGTGTVDGGSGGPTLTVGDNNATATFSGIIQNSGGTLTLAKIGSGTQTLSGASTFNGDVAVSGGLIAFASSPTTGGPLGNSTLVDLSDGGGISYTGSTANALNRPLLIGATSGRVDVANGTGNLTISSVTSTDGNLIKTGPGRATIAGTTVLNGGAAGVVVSGGTLVAGFGTGGIASLNVSAGSNMSFVNGQIEALTLGSGAGALTIAGGGRLGFEVDGATNDRITVGAGGTASVSPGVITFDFTSIGSGVTSGNTYTLLTSALGSLLPAGVTYVVGTAPSGFNYSINQSDTLVSVGVVTFSPKYWRGGQNASWATLGAAPANWSTDSAGLVDATAVPGIADTVIFSATAAPFTSASQIATTLDGNSTIFSLQFSAAPAGITAVNIDQGTSGTLTIRPTSANVGIEVGANAGAVTIGAPVVASNAGSAIQTWNVDGAGANGSSLTVGGAVTFNAKVIKTGAGTLTLSNAGNSGTADFALSGGTVVFNAANSLPTGLLTLGAIGGSAVTLDNNNAGALTLTNTSYAWNADISLPGQGLNLGTGAVSLGASVTLTHANVLTVGGVITDGGNSRSITKAGAGTLTLAGANTYGGGTVVTAGGLNINNDSAIGTGRLTLSSVTIDSTNGNHTLSTNNLQTWNNGAAIVFTGTSTLNMGTGAVTLGDATATTITLTNNSLLGGTSLTIGGDITPGIAGTAGAKILAISGAGSTALTGSINRGAAASLVITDTSPGTLTLSGPASLITSLLINGGSGSIVDIGAGSLTLSNLGTTGFKSTTGGTINATGGGTIVMGSSAGGTNYLDNGTAPGTTLTVNAKISGSFGFEVFDSTASTGYVVLTAQNTYAGETAVNGGNLRVSNIGNAGSLTSNLGAGSQILLSGTTSNAATAVTSILQYTGTGETTNRVISLSGTTNGGAIEQAGTGLLKFTSNFATPGAGAKTFYLMGSTAGTGEIAGLIINNSGTNTTGVTKLGTGTWTLSGISSTAANNYSGTTAINQGTLIITHATTAALSGGLAFGATLGGTTVGTLDLTNASATFGNLAVQTNSTSVNTIKVGTGKTLTFTGTALNVGYVEGTATNVDTTKLTIAGVSNGDGSLVVNNASAVVQVGVAASVQLTTSTTNTLDLSTLGSVSLGTIVAPITTLNVAFGQNAAGTLILSNTANVITATTLNDGHSNGANGGSGVITLGTGTNELNVNTFNIGFSKSSGTLAFASQTAGSPGTVTIQNKAGTGGAVLNIGSQNGTSTAGVLTGTLDLRGHNSTVNAGAVTLGNSNNGGGSGNASGVIHFDTGTFTAASVSHGLKSGSGGTGSNVANAINIGGGTFTVTGGVAMSTHTGTASGTSGVTSKINITGGTVDFQGSLSVASKNSATNTGTAAGEVNVSGGSLTVAGPFVLATQAQAGTATGLLSITGGSVTSNSDITDGGGTTTTTITLNGGTLDLTNHSIGSATVSVDALNFQSGTLRNLLEINNGGVLTKTGTGTLNLDGTNSYTGATNVNAGTLKAAGLNAFSANSALTLANIAGVTLDLNGFSNSVASLAGGGATGGNVTLGAGTLTTGGNGATTTFSGAITGGGGLTKAGAGQMTLASTGNSFAGATKVTGGTLAISGSISGTTSVQVDTGGILLMNGGDNNIGSGAVTPNAGFQTITGTPSGAALTGAGGTFAVVTGAGGNGTTHTFSSFTLSANSTLDFSSGVGTTNTDVNLIFSTLDAATKNSLFNNTTTLTINNWSGSSYVSQTGNGSATDAGLFGDTQDRLLFTTDPGFGTGNVIAGINFTGFGPGMQVQFGPMYEIVPVPEPSSIALLGTAGLLGLAGFRKRCRARKVLGLKS